VIGGRGEGREMERRERVIKKKGNKREGEERERSLSCSHSYQGG
jgi:hypothetical protein